MSGALSEQTRKTAILLLSLDKTMAADILGRLSRDKVEQVTMAIANTDRVTREEQEAVLSEFKAEFASRPLMQPSGPDTARELLERTIDQNEVEPLRQRMDERIQDGPFAFLHTRHADDIRLLIDGEHPQTITAIVAQLPTALAAQVMAGFDAAKQADLLARLARFGPTDADMLSEIAGLLQSRIGQIPVRVGGIGRASEVLQESSRNIARDTLQSLQRRDANLADKLRDSLFSFGDLGLLDDSVIAVILRDTQDLPWTIALKNCSPALRQRITGQLPKGLAKELNNQIDTVGPISLREISTAQGQISDAILSLEIEGQIKLPKRSSIHRNGLSSTTH